MAAQDPPRLVELAIAATRHRSTEAEKEAFSNPPYVEPEGLRPLYDRVRAELQAFLDAGGSDLITNRTRPGSGFTGTDAARIALNTSHPFWHFPRMVGNLVEFGILPLDDARAFVRAAPAGSLTASWVQQSIVGRLLTERDFEGAIAEANNPLVGDRDYRAWREIAWEWAETGDSAAFFSSWRQYKATVDKDEMRRLKERLIRGVSRRYGWREALRVTGDKRIGAAFASHAFAELSEAGNIDELLQLFETEPSLHSMPELDQLTIAVEAIRAASGLRPESDHPRLDGVADRIIALDPTLSKADMRARDLLLWTLASAVGEKSTLARLRKATRTPVMRREMMVLSRHDV